MSAAVKRQLQGVRFNAIVEHRRGAVQIHVIDVARLNAGIRHCQRHCAGRLVAAFLKTDAMKGITG